MTRKEAREQAFILVFEKLFQKDCSMEEIIALGDELSVPGDAENTLAKANGFTKELALGVEKEGVHIDALIGKYAIGWKIGRIPKVTLSILKIALYEMSYCENVPVSVSINEAVDLAKKYSTKEDSAFINGILGSYSRDLEKNDVSGD